MAVLFPLTGRAVLGGNGSVHFRVDWYDSGTSEKVLKSGRKSQCGKARRSYGDSLDCVSPLPCTSSAVSCHVFGTPSPSTTHSLHRKKSRSLSKRFPQRWSCAAQPSQDAGSAPATEDITPGSVSVILLSGGVGKRMGAKMPKQYLPLLGQPIALYSMKTFAAMEQVGEIIVVCEPEWREVFIGGAAKLKHCPALRFALPGKERQDSVFNGLKEVRAGASLACIHDSARPLVTAEETQAVLRDAQAHGAAVLGVPCKATIKMAGEGRFVDQTLDRKTLWEMQTPQVIEPGLLRRGFEYVNRNGLEVTDDVSIVEHLKHPVLITQGSYTNIKVTTPEDLILAEAFLSQGAEQEAHELVTATAT